jgi:predicted Rossmann fold flavoprotein
MRFDAIVMGGGAAGLYCALTAGRRGKRVAVLEHNAEVGRKIIISGGGRCNFTNIHTTPGNFISQNPHFCKSALSRFTPQDLIDLVKRHKIAYYEKKLGPLFCRESSRQIVDMLVSECRTARVDIRTGCTVSAVTKGDLFNVETNQGTFSSERLIVAAGGLSFAKIGATDLGYRLARQFGLKTVETRPSLVAMVLEGDSYRQLAGVSVDAAVSTAGQTFRENILFTHSGLSGPAILQISNYWSRDQPVSIDLMPEINAAEIVKEAASSRQTPANFLGRFFPQRFARDLAERTLPNKPLNQLSQADIVRLGTMLNDWQVRFRKTEGYDRAEVTLGGVSTDELSSQTMESKKVPGLYFIGEVVDVTGWLGGYNFQWAWASGFAAGSAI